MEDDDDDVTSACIIRVSTVGGDIDGGVGGVTAWAETLEQVPPFLASDEASYVNGAVIEVSGGMTV